MPAPSRSSSGGRRVEPSIPRPSREQPNSIDGNKSGARKSPTPLTISVADGLGRCLPLLVVAMIFIPSVLALLFAIFLLRLFKLKDLLPLIDGLPFHGTPGLEVGRN